MRAHANITVELGLTAAALTKTAPGGSINLAEQIRLTTQNWLDEMQLPVAAEVELTPVDQVRGPGFIDAAIILNGVRCGFSKRQLAQVYESSTCREVADLAGGVKAARELLTEATAKKDDSLALAQAFLAELVVETVKSSAEQVITPEVTLALLARAQQESATVQAVVKGLDQGRATQILRHLTRVHVGVQDAAAFVLSLFRGQAQGLTTGDLAEGFVNQWRADTIEIHLDPALAKTLLKTDPVPGTAYPAAQLAHEPANMLAQMCDELFYELGLLFPKINLVAEPKLSVNCCRFRLYQRLSPVLRGIGGDELLVDETPERLTAAGIAWRVRPHPVYGNPCAVVSRRSQHQLPAELTTWDQFKYIVLLLSSEIRFAASTLLSLDSVEELLGKLKSAFPALVAATLEQYRPREVAQVLRWLLHDAVSIRDLCGVLELMLNFSYTTGVRSPTAGWEGRGSYVYVGDAEFTGEPYFTDDHPYVAQFDMDTMQLFSEPAAEWIANGRIHAEFVKCGMRQYLSHKVSRGQNTIICYLVDPDIEMRLLTFRAAPEATNPPFSERELTEILKSMAEEFVESYRTPVLFLATTPDVALLLQDMVGEDFPEVIILHRQLVEESANVQPIARVP